MAQVVKVRRLANPRRRNAGKRVGRRKMTAKQIKHFGTRRQKAALKASRARKRHKPAARRRSNPVTRIVKRTVHVYRNKKRKAAKRANAHRRRRTSNPAPVILTLGAVNPQKRRSMAQRKRKRVASKRRNPSRRRRTRIVVSASHRRRTNPVGKRRRRRVNPARRHTRRRNPSMFGSPVGSMGTVKMVVGGLAGVAAAKFIPTLLPSSIVQGSITRVIATGASAFATGSFIGASHGSPDQFRHAAFPTPRRRSASVARSRPRAGR